MICTTKSIKVMDLTFSKLINQKEMDWWVYSNDRFDIACFRWFIFLILIKMKLDKLNRDDRSNGSKSKVWFEFNN